MNEGVNITIEVDEDRINKRIKTGYLDIKLKSFDKAIKMALNSKDNNEALSIGLLGNAAELFPKFVENKIIPDIVTDQTSAHDELNGYVPHQLSYEKSLELRKSNPDLYIKFSYESMRDHCQAMLDLQSMGSIVFDYGNNLRGQAKENGGFEKCI